MEDADAVYKKFFLYSSLSKTRQHIYQRGDEKEQTRTKFGNIFSQSFKAIAYAKPKRRGTSQPHFQPMLQPSTPLLYHIHPLIIMIASSHKAYHVGFIPHPIGF